MLTGQAKTDYQREYMQRCRAKNKDSALLSQKQGLENAPGLLRMDERRPVRPVRPKAGPVRPNVRPEPAQAVMPVLGITEIDEIPDGILTEVLEQAASRLKPIKPQSYNPMMIGYVPPKA